MAKPNFDFENQHGAWADGEIQPVELPHAVQEEPNPLREFAIGRMDDFWLRGLRILAQYAGNRSLALDCFLLAVGQGAMIGCETATDVSRKHFRNTRQKAAVTKIVVMFRTCLNIKDMPGQRSEDGRASMVRARERQLSNGS